MSVLYVLLVKYMQQMEDMKTVRRFSFLHIIKHLLEKIFFIVWLKFLWEWMISVKQKIFLKNTDRWLLMTIPSIFCSIRLQKRRMHHWMNRSEFWKNIKSRNLQRNGHMNWQPCITKQEKNRNVWIYAMKSFSGSVKANMLWKPMI